MPNLNELLTPPVIPAADKDGVLPPEFNDRPLTLEFTCWEGARVGFEYRYVWNFEIGRTAKSITAEDKPGNTLTLSIPARHLEAGTHKVGYFVRNPNSEIMYFSPTIDLIIHR